MLNYSDTSTVSLINFYTELLNQWGIAYRNKDPDEEEHEEGLTLRKYMAHAGHICLAGQVVGNDNLGGGITVLTCHTGLPPVVIDT